MKLLDDYQKLEKEIYEYFGFQEGWTVYPLEDCRRYYWSLNERDFGGGTVIFFEEPLTKEIVQEGSYYSNDVYTTRHLSKWVYRGPEYTMICVDTQTDGNKFLSIFDNKKEMKYTKDLDPDYNEEEEGWYLR